MVDTIKFSQMPSGGDLANNETTPGLQGGVNVLFNNPWTFLAPGTTAQRPAPSVAINYRLRLNTDTQIYEYYDAILGSWVQLSQSATFPGPFVTYTADAGLTGAQNLGLLANGILKQTISLGVATLDIAVQGTDYYGPGDTPTFAGMTLTGNLNMGGFTANNAANPINPQDYATKFYVDQTALNGTSVYAASAATLGTVTQSGAGVGATLTNAGVQAVFALDGVNPPVGANVLIKNTATGMTAANEGIYTVVDVGSVSTNWSIIRATSYDTATEINNTGLIAVQNGSTLEGTAWYNVSTIVTVDTTGFNYLEFGNIVFPISLAHGGTNANLTASNGGIFYSTSTQGAILAGTATAGLLLQSGATGPPSWLATANSSVLITSAGGVPSWSTTLPSSISASGMILTSPRIITNTLDTNGNQMFVFTPVASAVNAFNFVNSSSGNALGFSAVGTDPNITMSISGKGTGGAQRQGLMTGGAYSAGFAGSIITINIPSGTPVSLTNNTAQNVTSITVTPGVWDIFANAFFTASISFSAMQVWTSLTSGTAPDPSKLAAVNGLTSSYGGLAAPYLTVAVAVNTTVYLGVLCSFGAGTATACGSLTAVMR